MITTGVDLMEIDRMAAVIERHGDRFLMRIFTPKELALFKNRIGSLAARFAAKEAVAKALCTGIGEVEWVHIEILSGPNKEPVLYLHGKAKQVAEEKGLQTWSISLSHTHEHAVAMVVAVREK
jgi:holo-[acyl-carrier protein] synthase